MNEKHRIKATPTKAEKRRELEREIEKFLNAGGEVTKIPNGQSGNELNVNLFSKSATFGPKQERTPLNDVVQELEARKKNANSAPKNASGPRKQLLRDDFGDPIRWVWVEDKAPKE